MRLLKQISFSLNSVLFIQSVYGYCVRPIPEAFLYAVVAIYAGVQVLRLKDDV